MPGRYQLTKESTRWQENHSRPSYTQRCTIHLYVKQTKRFEGNLRCEQELVLLGFHFQSNILVLTLSRLYGP